MAETTSVSVAPPNTAGTSFVEWGAVIAGGVMAAAISFVLLTFGTAIGLSFVSPWQEAGAPSKMVASLAVFWTISQQIGALIAGGYIAGRMRSRWAEKNADETEFRDGLHGGLVWAVSVVITAFLVLSTAGAVVKTATDAAGRVAAASVDPMAYQIDAMLRPAAGTRSPSSATAVPGSTSGARSGTASDAELRGELTRTFARAVTNGTFGDDDRKYVASVVAQHTGLTQEEAERRITTAYNEASRLAKETAEKARRAALLTGFVTAAALLVSLAAAWWSAIKGGDHRDKSIPARFVMAPRPR